MCLPEVQGFGASIIRLEVREIRFDTLFLYVCVRTRYRYDGRESEK
jgi:hypothetical protein